ncbi:MAG: radical SAM protein [Bacteroidales bacterium]
MTIKSFRQNGIIDSIYTIERGGAYFLFYDLAGMFFEVSQPTFAELKKRSSNNVAKILSSIQSYLTNKRTTLIDKNNRSIKAQKQRASLRIEVSNICNNKCAYCHVFKIGKYRSRKSVMPYKDARNVIADFLELASRYRLCESYHINFYGGEPLITWNLIKTLISNFGLHHKRKRIVWSINTNGRLLRQEMMPFLKKYDVELHIGCDGMKDINDKLRRSSKNEGTFDEIQNAFNLANKYGVYKQINAVISNSNISKLRDIVDVAKENNVQVIYLDVLYMQNKLLNINRLAEAYKDVVKYSEQHQINLGGCCTNLVTRIKKKRMSVAMNKYDLLRSISISTDGGIYPTLFRSTPISKRSLSTYFDEDNVAWQENFNDLFSDLSTKCSRCFLHRYCNFAGILQYRYHTKLEKGHNDSCAFLKEYVLAEMIDEIKR